MLVIQLPRIPELENQLFDIDQVDKIEEELLELKEVINNMDRVEPEDEDVQRLVSEGWDVVQAIAGLFQILVSDNSFLPGIVEREQVLHTVKLQRKYKAKGVTAFRDLRCQGGNEGA